VTAESSRPLASLAGIDRYLETLDHETLLVRRGARSGLFTIAAVHSTARGPALGGCRMWTYSDSRAALRDALRLSRAMTFKAAVAGLPLGGGKGVIVLPGAGAPTGERRRAVLLDFGDTVDALGGAYLTAEDVGTSEPDMQVIAERTRFVTGLSEARGGSGDPSPWTAVGCEAAAHVTLERALGSADLAGRRVAVLGLGHVGGRLAERFAEAGARLVVCDVDPGKRALAERLGAEWVDPDTALRAEVDLLAPCALGGVLDHATVPELRCRAIAGAANNQLASDEIAGLLAERGILWAPDFVCNAGGIINISVELEPEGYAPDRADTRVRAIGDTLRAIFDAAEAEGTTPLAAASALARRRLSEAAPAAAA
jgi:leucine dehydrogenase